MSDSVESVTYSLAYKRALPGYENVTPFFSVSKTVPEGSSLDEVKAELVAKVEGWMTEKINEIDADAKS